MPTGALTRSAVAAVAAVARRAVHRPPRRPEKRVGATGVLTTMLFTDIVRSSGVAAALGTRQWRRLLERHHAAVRRELQRFGGREVDTAGDGVFTTFGSPSDAIGCGQAIVRAVAELGLDVRVGIHAGECEFVEGKPCGLPVHIGARVVAAADPGEVVVTETIRTLAVGLPFRFVDLGTRTFASIPGEWRLLKVAAAGDAP